MASRWEEESKYGAIRDGPSSGSRKLRMDFAGLGAVMEESRRAFRKGWQKRWRWRAAWPSWFAFRPRGARRNVIAKPWFLPIIAHHLAAMEVQRHVRGMLTRMRMAGLLAAREARPPLQLQFLALLGADSRMLHRVQTTQRLPEELVDGYRNWCATKLQSCWRMHRARLRYNWSRFPVYEIAAVQLQFAWRTYCQQRLLLRVPVRSRHSAAVSIQRAWRSYTNGRIFRYYRSLLNFHNQGDPAQMLRAFNPTEAGLIDAAAGVHVRFRLGGAAFPPAIYYKIFTHRPLVDIGAFSPKDYAHAVHPTAKELHSHPKRGSGAAARRHRSSRKLAEVDDADERSGSIRVGKSTFAVRFTEETMGEDRSGWYRRVENNGWRPITVKELEENEADVKAAEARAEAKAEEGVPFHPVRTVRREERQRLAKMRKRKWMMKMYKAGMLKERERPGEPPVKPSGKLDDDDDEGKAAGDAAASKLPEIDFDSEEWEDEVNDLLTWSSALDYEEYARDWTALGTSERSEMFIPAHFIGKMEEEDLEAERLAEEEAAAGLGPDERLARYYEMQKDAMAEW